MRTKPELLDEMIELAKVLETQPVPEKDRYLLIHEGNPWYDEVEKAMIQMHMKELPYKFKHYPKYRGVDHMKLFIESWI